MKSLLIIVVVGISVMVATKVQWLEKLNHKSAKEKIQCTLLSV